MTQPRNTIQEGRSRYYVWPPVGHGERELKVPSVTTIIGGGIPKDALKGWAAKMAAQYAVEHKTAWEKLPSDDAVDLIKRSSIRYTEKRAEEGSLVHWAIEDYLGGKDNPDRLEDDELRNQYLGALQFLKDTEAELLHVEGTVYSRKHRYAGTADLIGYFTLPGGDRVLSIGDWKTGKAIYDEYAIQLTAYSRGDFVASGLDAVPMPSPGLAGASGLDVGSRYIDSGIVIRPKRDGGYEAKQFKLTNDLFVLFRAARVVYQRWGAFKGSQGRVWEMAA